jgi:hypothetical protein
MDCSKWGPKMTKIDVKLMLKYNVKTELKMMLKVDTKFLYIIDSIGQENLSRPNLFVKGFLLKYLLIIDFRKMVTVN